MQKTARYELVLKPWGVERLPVIAPFSYLKRGRTHTVRSAAKSLDLLPCQHLAGREYSRLNFLSEWC